MATTGTVTLETESVDYGGGRGACKLTNVIGWEVNDSGDIHFWPISSTDNVHGTWGICGTASWYGVAIEPQVSYDNGGSWTSLATEFQAVSLCPSLTNTIATSTTLINRLGTYHLDDDCLLRFLYYANATPAPSQSLPNAFPDSGYSAVVQVPVEVIVVRPYKPGATLDNSNGEVWLSNNNAIGACHMLTDAANDSWMKMDTINGADNARGNAPVMYRGSSGWYNQKWIGKRV